MLLSKVSNVIIRFFASLLVMSCFVLSGSSTASGANNYSPEIGCSSPSDACWEYGFHYPGVIGIVYAVAEDTAGNIYVGGEISSAGGIEVGNIAKWDGTSWSSLGNISHTSYTASVRALAVDGSGYLYAGGTFDHVGTIAANNIAKWNGSNWVALDSGTDSSVNAIELDSGSGLYAGGTFEQAGDTTVAYVAYWNGTTWSALDPDSGVYDYVYAIELDSVNNYLYVGCSYGSVGGLYHTDLAQYNLITNQWTAWSGGMGGTIYGLYLLNGSGSAISLYVGGAFDYINSVLVKNIARWDGTNWYAMANGTDGVVNTLARASSGTLYVGGAFSTPANNIASWNGSAWSALDSGVGGEVNAVLMSGMDKVIVAGDFDLVTDQQYNSLASWDPVGSQWSGLDGGLGMYSTVYALKTYGASVYAAGSFSYAGPTFVGGLGELDGSTWTGFEGFTNYHVYDMATDGTNMYVGGGFGGDYPDIGAVEADYLAVWNGSSSSWAELGGGTNGYVNALVMDGIGNLYVGGEFTQVGGVQSASHIARYEIATSTWYPLDDGLGNDVEVLIVDDEDNLYVGGDFLYAGDLYVGHIAMWDGHEWHSLNGGLSNSVYGLEIDGDGRLYAAGTFLSASGQGLTLNGIGMWNGEAWSALDSGMDYGSYVVEMDSNGYLYAGGSFETAGGVPANNIARWDGFNWSALGSGTDNSVRGLAVLGNRLFAGGFFYTAGGKTSKNIGAYDLPPAVAAPVPTLVSLSPNMASSGRAGFWISVSGSDFSSRSVVRWQGETLLTTYVDGTQLLAYIPSDKLTLAGEFDVTVLTPAASGGGSSITSLPFLVLGNHQYLPLLMR